jgi:tripartite-type tricarboxylate transporter receptor subunit TctC
VDSRGFSINWSQQTGCRSRGEGAVVKCHDSIQIGMIARGLIGWVSFAVVLFATVLPATAQKYPAKPVTVVVGLPAGASIDVAARIVASDLSTRLGQSFNVQNRTGAAGRIAAETAARSPADGHTLLIAGPGILAFEPRLRERSISFVEPVSLIATIPHVVVVPSNSRFNTLRDLLQASPDTRMTATATDYFSMILLERLRLARKQNLTRIEFKSAAEGLVAVLGGQVDLAVASYAAARPHIEAGRVRVIAGTGDIQDRRIAGVAGLKDVGMDPDTQGFVGLFAPRGTPKDIVTQLSKTVTASVTSPAVGEQLRTLGFVPRGGPPEELVAAIRNVISAIPDPCKLKAQCEADPGCPRPCPLE